MDGEVVVSTSQVITTSGEVGGLKSVIAKPCFFLFSSTATLRWYASFSGRKHLFYAHEIYTSTS